MVWCLYVVLKSIFGHIFLSINVCIVCIVLNCVQAVSPWKLAPPGFSYLDPLVKEGSVHHKVVSRRLITFKVIRNLFFGTFRAPKLNHMLWVTTNAMTFIGPRSNNCLTDWCCCQTKHRCCKIVTSDCQNCQMLLYKGLQSFKVVTGICQSSPRYLWKLTHVFVKAVKEWANRITLSVC